MTDDEEVVRAVMSKLYIGKKAAKYLPTRQSDGPALTNHRRHVANRMVRERVSQMKRGKR